MLWCAGELLCETSLRIFIGGGLSSFKHVETDSDYCKENVQKTRDKPTKFTWQLLKYTSCKKLGKFC